MGLKTCWTLQSLFMSECSYSVFITILSHQYPWKCGWIPGTIFRSHATKFGVAVSILLVQWCSNELQPGVAQRRHDRFTQTKMSECSYLLADEGYIGLETMEEDDHLL